MSENSYIIAPVFAFIVLPLTIHKRSECKEIRNWADGTLLFCLFFFDKENCCLGVDIVFQKQFPYSSSFG